MIIPSIKSINEIRQDQRNHAAAFLLAGYDAQATTLTGLLLSLSLMISASDEPTTQYDDPLHSAEDSTVPI